jgi:hypothetical protein
MDDDNKPLNQADALASMGKWTTQRVANVVFVLQVIVFIFVIK